MALVIEDGTGLATANSYATAVEASAYATARGVSLSGGDAAVEAKLVQAMDYLEAQRSRYQGHKTWPVGTVDHPAAQALQWPRAGVVIDCTIEWPDNAIPPELKNAQMQCVVELQKGYDLMPSTDGRVVKKTKVDVIEKEFFSATDLGQSGTPTPSFPSVDALLAPLFSACGANRLKTVRV